MRHIKRGLTALVILTLVLLPTPAVHAQPPSCGLGTVVPMTSASETITVSSAAVGFTASKYTTSTANAVMAQVLVENDAIRFWDDTQTPTASVGRKVSAGVEFTVCGVLAIRQFRMIRVTTDATVSVSYYRGE